MQLSRYGEGEPSRPDTARLRAAKDCQLIRRDAALR